MVTKFGGGGRDRYLLERRIRMIDVMLERMSDRGLFGKIARMRLHLRRRRLVTALSHVG